MTNAEIAVQLHRLFSRAATICSRSRASVNVRCVGWISAIIDARRRQTLLQQQQQHEYETVKQQRVNIRHYRPANVHTMISTAVVEC